jgi:hypothetical protein
MLTESETHILAAHPEDTKPVSQPTPAVTIHHLSCGIVSASRDGVTATGMTEEVALRELVRKVERTGARPAG